MHDAHAPLTHPPDPEWRNKGALTRISGISIIESP